MQKEIVTEVVLNEEDPKLRYFFLIDKEKRNDVEKWLSKQHPFLHKKRDFLKSLREALEEIDYDYYISTLEPSVKDGKIIFEKGLKLYTQYKIEQWYEMVKQYHVNAKISTVHELFIFYAWRVAKGYLTLSQLCVDSSKIGNHRYSPTYANGLENSGARVCAGFRDGLGNTPKIAFENAVAMQIGVDFRYKNEDITITSKQIFINRVALPSVTII